MSSEENSIKAQHGVKAKRTLDYVVRELESYGALSSHEDSPAYGYDDHDKMQFKADKSVTTAGGEKCILYSTNSIRSDRVKGQQWDAYNIKQIDNKVEYAYIIIPDEDALKGSVSFREKMRNGEMFTAIDDILTVDEFYEREIARYGQRLNSGVRHDLEGRKFEDYSARSFQAKKTSIDSMALGMILDFFMRFSIRPCEPLRLSLRTYPR